MPKLENFDNFIKVDGNPFAKNAINYQVSDGFVSLYYISQDRILQKTRANFSDWTDKKDNPYRSILELTTDLDNFLFSSLSLQSVIDEVKVTNDILKDTFVYLKVISNQLESLEEDGGNLGIKELKDSVLN